MLLGYGQPKNITATVSNGLGTHLQALTDGRPSSIARLSGKASIQLRLDWPTPTPVRLVTILGLSCLAGTNITLTGKRTGDSGYTYALGGNAALQPAVQLSDGSRAAWFVLNEDNASLIGLQISIDTDSTDTGEVAIMQAVNIEHNLDWQVDRIDPSHSSRTIGGQLNTVPRRSYRRLHIGFTPDMLSNVRANGLANHMDWDQLETAILNDQRCIAIPRWRTPSGDIDTAELHRTALYGKANSSGIAHLGGNYYQSSWSFEEIPPI